MFGGDAPGNEMREAIRDDAGFAGARAGQDQNRAVQSLDGAPLLRIERIQI